MSLFERLVAQALQNQGELAPLRTVVEKELLHHDVLREMSTAGLLERLTFIGGTCLRTCYGSNRLSEDLDFTGGKDFKREALISLGALLAERLQIKYNLRVEVSEPVKESGNVDIWKVKIVTQPQFDHLPSQKIHIDICFVPSYDRHPLVLRNHYGIEMGTSGLIIQAQSREEILADKLVAFALRPNRVKNRDLWDIGWLKQQNISLPLKLVPKKIADHQYSLAEFLELLQDRNQQLRDEPTMRKEFIHEMRRFLPPKVAAGTVENEDFWTYLTNLIHDECESLVEFLASTPKSDEFRM